MDCAVYLVIQSTWRNAMSDEKKYNVVVGKDKNGEIHIHFDGLLKGVL